MLLYQARRRFVTNVIKTVEINAPRTAVIDKRGSYSYGELLGRAQAIAHEMPASVGPGDRFCFLVEPGVEFVATLWAAWLRGLVAVPLCIKHPIQELKYIIGAGWISALSGFRNKTPG